MATFHMYRKGYSAVSDKQPYLIETICSGIRIYEFHCYIVIYLYIYTKIMKKKSFAMLHMKVSIATEGANSRNFSTSYHFDDSYHFTQFIGECLIDTNLLCVERLNHRKLLDNSALSHSVTMTTA